MGAICLPGPIWLVRNGAESPQEFVEQGRYDEVWIAEMAAILRKLLDDALEIVAKFLFALGLAGEFGIPHDWLTGASSFTLKDIIIGAKAFCEVCGERVENALVAQRDFGDGDATMGHID